MTPAEIVLMARRRYNAVSDTFWSDQELYDVIYQSCLEVADEAYAVEATYTTPTVSGTQEYSLPAATIAVKRVTWNGRKLTRIDMIEDDVLTALNQNTTATGTPEFYWVWDDTISLRPVPNDAQDLKIWALNEPSSIASASQTLDLPTQFHGRLVNPVLSAMAAKDTNFTAAQYYQNMWEKDKVKIRQSVARMKRTDKFTTVKDEMMVVETYIGGT